MYSMNKMSYLTSKSKCNHCEPESIDANEFVYLCNTCFGTMK